MRISWSLGALALAVSQLILASPVKAALFPDVPEGHLYQTSVERLAGLKIISGNPDGTFLPEKAVNRAEMLAMLYRATGKTPDASKRGCFGDVQPGSWYELYVCDAAAKGYVKGYPDGGFKPNNALNHVEALKMIATVFGFEVPSAVATEDKSLVTFTDVNLSEWYGPYLVTALKKKILPIAGTNAKNFFPQSPSLRGETAAMIEHALFPPSGASVTSAANSSMMNQQTSSAGATASRRASAASSTASTPVKDLVIPSSVSGNFKKKAPAVYRFTLTTSMMISVDVKLGGSFVDEHVSCRLYNLKSDGFSDEYYLGYEETALCQLRTKLAPGSYQLELQPTANDAVYTLEVKTMKGDNNDGFSEAKTLLPTQPRSDQLDVGDMADWYKFTLAADKEMTVLLVNDGNASCILYPMSDVDIFGFESPSCDEKLLFPKGSYYVGVIRKNGRHEKTIYTLQMK